MTERRFYEGPIAGQRRSAPAALRNREAIAGVLAEWLPPRGLVVEVASGTGEHVVHFAERFPGLDWQPSDINDDALASIAAWHEESGLRNVRPPLRIDVMAPDWPIDRADALLSINMVHISPWDASLGLLDGARRLLSRGAPLILYGPWLSAEIDTADSNLAFDAQLKSVDPEWGLRHVETFAEAAAGRGFRHAATRPMPANNLMLKFEAED
jgi:hypothetical protein